jgi:uncharacterized protein YndB with AHSA1/START domain
MNNALRITPASWADGNSCRATIEIPASPERIFEALTSKENEIWWGSPEVYTTVDWKADVRVGGKWSLGTRLPNGEIMPASGRFVRLEPPRLIVLTRTYEFDHPTMGWKTTTVTYITEPIDGGSRVTVLHEGFNGSMEAALEHAHGWERLLTWLAKYLSAEQNNDQT